MKRILIGLFILVVCVPLIFSFVIISKKAENRVEKIMQNRSKARLKIAGNILDKVYDDLFLKAKIISQLDDVKKLIINNSTIKLIDRLNNLRHDLRLNIYDGGIEIFNSSGSLMVAEPRNPFILTEKASIKNALSGLFSTSKRYYLNNLIFTAVVPIYQLEASIPIGVISVSILINSSLADEIKKITNTDITFFSSYLGNYNIQATTVMNDGQRHFPILPGLKDGEMTVRSGSKHYIVNGRTYNIKNGKFVLAVVLENKELKDILSYFRQLLIKIAMYAILFALILGIIFSSSITKPIDDLVIAAEAFADGNLEHTVTINGIGDEFYFLGKTFDNMREQIKSKINELKQTNITLDRKVFDLSVRNLINQAIIDKNEEGVFKEMLQIIVNTMDAKRSSLLLIDPQTDKLALKIVVFRNSSGDLQFETKSGGMTFELGEGIAGYVAKTGKAMISNSPENDIRFKPDATGKPLKNLITLPLRSEKETIGVVNISDRETDFTDEDKNLLQAIADQIAIALQKAKLYELAITDGMTGLYIHRYFQMRLEAEVTRAKRTKENISLLMFDIDHFKKFNDTYGHQTGDKVIKLVAAIIKQSIREGIDIPARYGGEEFTVIMPETNIQGAGIFAERLRKAIETTTIMYEEKELHVTISVGCASFPSNAKSRMALIKCADDALYVSKENGRNCVSYCEIKA